jgi:60 kDa SS-A/Ro ribonucleoprotein
MSFNTAKKPVHTTNLAGGHAVKFKDPNFALYSMVASNFVDNSFYQTAGQNLSTLRAAVGLAEPMFVAKLAIYARTVLNLRTAPLVLMIELARIHRGDSLVSRGLMGCIKRADECAEALAYYKLANGRGSLKKLSKQVSKGIAGAFLGFDEYQLAKYQGKGKEISLRDAMFLTHPKPQTEEQAALFARLAAGTLEVPETWETKKSAAGKEGGSSAKVWEDMIDSRKMGYMATLRNLRNFIQDDISMGHIQNVAKFLATEHMVANSKQMPFRFYTAWRELSQLGVDFKISGAKVTALMKAVEEAGIISLKNLTLLNEDDVVMSIVDVSGSMGAGISSQSSLRCAEVALFYGSMMNHLNANCRLGYFGQRIGFEENLRVNPFENSKNHSALSSKYGHSTNAHLIFDALLKADHKVDKVFVWTDCQFWTGNGFGSNASFMHSWNAYSKKFPGTKLVLLDLVGRGSSAPIQLKGNTAYISGFSQDTFKMLDNMTNTTAILQEIEAIEL